MWITWLICMGGAGRATRWALPRFLVVVAVVVFAMSCFSYNVSLRIKPLK